LFGLRKFDMVATLHGIGFVKGKRSSGYFSISMLDGTKIHASAKAVHCQRITARSTTLTERHRLFPAMNDRVSADGL
jgi:hypothetical protein